MTHPDFSPYTYYSHSIFINPSYFESLNRERGRGETTTNGRVYNPGGAGIYLTEALMGRQVYNS